ncbi:MAG TPA: hypothetical protein VH301_16465 [Usitatibacter sp.]|nr:hypothetical protein [Usitatibacter sp.]
MTMQQRLATAFLALLIVGSVAMMPAEADSKQRAHVPQQAKGFVTTPSATREPRVQDLTYN